MQPLFSKMRGNSGRFLGISVSGTIVSEKKIFNYSHFKFLPNLLQLCELYCELIDMHYSLYIQIYLLFFEMRFIHARIPKVLSEGVQL